MPSSIMRNDGDITVFVLRHVHPHTIEKGWDKQEWSDSGACDQFEIRGRNLSIFKPLTASGNCWQQYGIFGSFDVSDVNACCFEMAKHFPEFHWAVFEVSIRQETRHLMSCFAQPERKKPAQMRGER